jgi:hypothetical protein
MARHLRELSGRRECSVLGEVVPLLMGLIVVVAAQSLLHAVSAHAGGSYAISILHRRSRLRHSAAWPPLAARRMAGE